MSAKNSFDFKAIENSISSSVKDYTSRNSLVDMLKDLSELLTTAVMTVVTINAVVNTLKVNFMNDNSKKKKKDDTSPIDYLRSKNSSGKSMEERLRDNKRRIKNLNSDESIYEDVELSSIDEEVLDCITEHRNLYFRRLNNKQKLEVLALEDIKFDKYKEVYIKNSKKFFKKADLLEDLYPQSRYYEYRECGIGFIDVIGRKVQDAYHWLKEDKRKKPKQAKIELWEEYPSADLSIDDLEKLKEIKAKVMISSKKRVANSELGVDLTQSKEDFVRINEIGKGNTYKEYRRKVENAAMSGKSLIEYFNDDDQFDDDTSDFSQRKQGKKRKTKSSKSSKSYGSSYSSSYSSSIIPSFMEEGKSKKKNKKNNKDKNKKSDDNKTLEKAEKNSNKYMDHMMTTPYVEFNYSSSAANSIYGKVD